MFANIHRLSQMLTNFAPRLLWRMLAARGISGTAALLVPSLRLEAGRLLDTRHLFANAGDPAEGVRRLRAWEWASNCRWPPGAQRAARESVERGVDAMLVADCGPEEQALRGPVLRHQGANFREVARESGFVLYLRR